MHGQPMHGQAPGQPPGHVSPGKAHSGERPLVAPGQPAAYQQPLGAPYAQPGGPGGPGGGPPPATKPKGRRWGLLLIILGIFAAMVLVVVVGVAIFGGGDDESFEVGNCLREGPDKQPVEVSCEHKDAFRIEKRVEKESECEGADATVELRGDGGHLCLRKVE